jgi:hypothetical protein
MEFQAGAGFDLLDQRLRQAGIALAEKPRFIGNASAAPIIDSICQGPGVQVVA